MTWAETAIHEMSVALCDAEGWAQVEENLTGCEETARRLLVRAIELIQERVEQVRAKGILNEIKSEIAV